MEISDFFSFIELFFCTCPGKFDFKVALLDWSLSWLVGAILNESFDSLLIALRSVLLDA